MLSEGAVSQSGASQIHPLRGRLYGLFQCRGDPEAGRHRQLGYLVCSIQAQVVCLMEGNPLRYSIYNDIEKRSGAFVAPNFDSRQQIRE